MNKTTNECIGQFRVGVIDAHAGGAAKGSVVIAFACVTLGMSYCLFVPAGMYSYVRKHIFFL